MEKVHQSVLVREVIAALEVVPGGVYLDATFGEGGHTEALFESGAGRVYAIDRDLEAIERYRAQGKFGNDPRLIFIHGRFSQVAERLGEERFDGIVVDLGPSTRQLLDAERGFSFSNDGPLDMRMDQTETQNVLDILRELPLRLLQKSLSQSLSPKKARLMATRIKESIHSNELHSTFDLAKLSGPKHGKRHPATEFFLSLRMLVNRELSEIEEGLPSMIRLLKPGKRLAVITFHSTEDRLVKQLFRKVSGYGELSLIPDYEATAQRVTKKTIKPTREEMLTNPRCRSAQLRCVEKLSLNA